MCDLRYLRASHVAFYMAAGGEMDPWPAMTAAAGLGKRCYLPVMTDRLRRWQQAPLAFQAFDPAEGEFRINRYGILEPAFDPRALIRPEQLDVVIIPLVGFDRAGNRVGMGQGFYDRTFARVRRGYRRPWLVGCAFSIQEAGTVLANPWDVPMDAIVTEKGIIDSVIKSGKGNPGL